VRIPELLYQLAREPASSGPLIELFTRRQVDSATNVNVTSVITGPPKDRLLILTNISIDLNPGLTQAVIRAVFNGITPAGVTFGIRETGFTAVADFRQGFSWQGEVAVGGGGVNSNILTILSVFDAGVAENFVAVSVFGYVVPRGNIAPF